MKRYETAYTLLQKLRAAMVNPDRTSLTGRVEVDESYIGGSEPGKRGRGAEGKYLVVGAVEGIAGQVKGPTQEALYASGPGRLDQARPRRRP